MKIAWVTFAFGEYSIRLASALARQADVSLWISEREAAPHLHRVDSALKLQMFHQPRLRQALRQIRFISVLVQQLRKAKPDVIHLQQGYLWFNPVLPLLRQHPLVLTIHDPTYHLGDKESQKTPHAITTFGFRHANQLIVHNEAMKQVVMELLPVAPANIHVVPTVVRGDDTLQTHLQEERHTLLFFGRIWPYKGLEYLIRAEPLISAQIPDLKIIIAGAGEDLARYYQMMVHPERFVVYNEYIPQEQMAALFRRASVVVLPYVEATQSGVIPTAYTYAKPVVATTVGGLPSMIDPGETGLLVPPRNEQALADALIQLLQDDDLRHRMGNKGKFKVATDYSAEQVARQTLAVYRQAAGEVKSMTDGPSR